MRRESVVTTTGMSPGISMGLMLVLLLLLCMAGTARATDLLYTGTGFNETSHDITIAMELIPGQDIRVTDLGVFIGGVDGPDLQTAYDVGLWDASGVLLATASVDNNATQQNGYRFTPITPVVLTAGQNYILGAYYPVDMVGDKLVASTLTPAPFVSLFSNTRFAGGTGGLTFPDGSSTIPDFTIAANLLYEPVDLSPVDISGTVKDQNGADLCAMALASGRYMFTCNPLGDYAFSNLPRRKKDGVVKLQVFADGYFPWTKLLTGSGVEPVTMTPVGSCPNYNPPSNSGVYPGSAGKRIDIDGTITVGSSGAPVCAMVLASGKYTFTCNATGSYNMNVPLNANGQVKIQVFADGFATYILKIDEFQPTNNIQLAESSECSP